MSLHKPNKQLLKDIKYFRKSSFVNVSMFVILSFNLDSSVVTIVYGYNDTRESKIKLFSIPGSFPVLNGLSILRSINVLFTFDFRKSKM